MEKILFNLKNQIENNSKKIIVLGKFKTFHRGHQLIFLKAKRLSEEKNKEVIVMLYPDYDGFSKSVTKSFLTLNERIEILKSNYGFKYFLIFEPNLKNYSIPIIKFIEYLKNNLNIDEIVIGKDFTFGKNDPNEEKILKSNFTLHKIPMLKFNNQIISSSLIKFMIENGEVEDIRKLTNFNYFYKGVVKIGKQLGSKFNTPTINLKLEYEKLTPQEGIYFTFAYFDGKKYNSITSISNNPTFNEKNISFETYIFNFDKKIYNSEVKIEFLKFLRKPIKFENIEDLYEKIENDKKKAIIFFNNFKN